MTAPAGVTLGWGKGHKCSARHYSSPKPCRLCGLETPLRDCDGRPCHKVCAELEATTATDRAMRAATRHRPTQEATG